MGEDNSEASILASEGLVVETTKPYSKKEKVFLIIGKKIV